MGFFTSVGNLVGTYFGYPGAGTAIGSLFDSSSDQSMGDPNVGPQQQENVSATPTTTITGSSFPSNNSGWAALGSAGIGALGQISTNAANARQAQAQMDFQASQTGTSYQRAVKDMQAAGLNPMLAYSQGGAASGGGSSAVMGNPAATALSSAPQAATTLQTLDNMRTQNEQMLSQIDLTNAQRANTAADTKVKLQQAPYTAAQTRLADAGLGAALADSARRQGTLGYDIASAKSASEQIAAEAEISKYDIQRARLGAAGADSGFRRYVAPFTGALSDIFNSAGSARRAIGH